MPHIIADAYADYTPRDTFRERGLIHAGLLSNRYDALVKRAIDRLRNHVESNDFDVMRLRLERLKHRASREFTRAIHAARQH